MTVDVHYFDIHADGNCDLDAVRVHVPIVGGMFDGCTACFRLAGYPALGRVYRVGMLFRFAVREVPERKGIAAHLVLRDVAPW